MKKMLFNKKNLEKYLKAFLFEEIGNEDEIKNGLRNMYCFLNDVDECNMGIDEIINDYFNKKYDVIKKAKSLSLIKDGINAKWSQYISRIEMNAIKEFFDKKGIEYTIENKENWGKILVFEYNGRKLFTQDMYVIGNPIIYKYSDEYCCDLYTRKIK